MSPLARVCLWSLLAVGCADDGAAPAAPAAPTGLRCEVPKRTPSMVLARFAFVRSDPMRAMVSDGFDLDGAVTAQGGVTGCGRGDFTGPDGTQGVDNQLAQLLPAVDAMTGGALDGAIQGAINNGQLLMTFTLEGLDNRCDDPDVTLVFSRVAGMPFTGSDMLVDPGQTFDLMRDAPRTRIRARIAGGVLLTERTDLPLPVAVFGVRFVLNIYGARMRLALRDDGGATGVLGGGISIDEFMREANTFDIPNQLRSTIGTTMRLVADLAPGADGRCQQLSTAVSVVARPAFVNP